MIISFPRGWKDKSSLYLDQDSPTFTQFLREKPSSDELILYKSNGQQKAATVHTR